MNKKLNNKYIKILLTNRCNLKCNYCYEYNKKNKNIQYDELVKIIDKELINHENYNYIKIQFFGGEPLLEFEKMKSIVEYIKSKNIGNVKLAFTTNGTILTSKIKEWLLENKDILSCQLSLDGCKKAHDINRNNSFDKIDLEFFKSYSIENPIRMTISSDTIDMMAESIIFCHENGFKVNCALSKNTNIYNDDNLKKYIKELDKLAKYYVDNPTIKVCSLLNILIENVYKFRNNNFIVKWCGAGKQSCSYDVDGCKYPCQMLMPTSENKKINYDQFIFFENIPLNLLNKRCTTCPLVHICNSCIAENYYDTGKLYVTKDEICNFRKATIYYAKEIVKGRYNKDKLNKDVLESFKIIDNVCDNFKLK